MSVVLAAVTPGISSSGGASSYVRLCLIYAFETKSAVFNTPPSCAYGPVCVLQHTILNLELAVFVRVIFEDCALTADQCKAGDCQLMLKNHWQLSTA